jgi:nucleoside-diphosphate-sugar epimerase
MAIHTILGAGGVIAEGLTQELVDHGQRVRLVSRQARPSSNPSPEIVVQTADLTDPSQALKAVQGSDIVYLCVGLKYDYAVWRQQWPRIMTNTIEACKQTQARLVFFDNVYMYGRVEGPMTEDTPYNPSSRKGDLRARIATQLMSEVRKGNITAMITRSADFYGPGAGKTGLPNLLVFQRLAKGLSAQWPVNINVRHSFTHTGDAVRAMYLLASDENAWNQAWHLPTAANPLTASRFIEIAAEAMGRKQSTKVLAKWMIRLAGLFDKTTSELYEMLYQYEFDYLFDSSKFEKAYPFPTTSYEEGIRSVVLRERSRN